MSEFFKALEQAERDRALQRGRRPDDPEPAAFETVEPAAVAPAAPPAEERAAPTVADEPLAPSLFTRAADRLLPQAEEPEEDDDEVPDGVDEHMVSLLTPTAFEAEQYRGLRLIVEQLRESSGLAMIAVSSPSVGDGKTTTAINLAGALAQAADARVLLVDADLRRPTLAYQIGLADPGPGLVGAIVDRSLTLGQVVRGRPPFNLSVLAAGRPPAAPYELLKSPRLAELLEEARRAYDYVVLDTPPLVTVPDCRVLSPVVDGFLLVVAAHRTPRKLLDEALGALEPAKVLGLVYNADDRPLAGYKDYEYTYGAASANGHGAPTGRLARVVRTVGGLVRRRALRA